MTQPNLGKFLGSNGVMETILGLFGVPKENRFSSDRIGAIGLALLGVFAAYTGQDPGTFSEQVVGALSSFWNGSYSAWSDLAVILGAFGIGRSGSSARSF